VSWAEGPNNPFLTCNKKHLHQSRIMSSITNKLTNSLTDQLHGAKSFMRIYLFIYLSIPLILNGPIENPAVIQATQEFSNIIWNLKFHYHVHRSLPHVPILSQMNSVHTTSFYFLRSTLILFSHWHLGHPTGLIPFGFPTEILNAFLLFHYMLCSSHPSRLDHFNYIWQSVQVMKHLFMQFLPAPIMSPLLVPHILRSTMFSNTLSPCPSLNVRYQYHTHTKPQAKL
jgi:hypothetical protein